MGLGLGPLNSWIGQVAKCYTSVGIITRNEERDEEREKERAPSFTRPNRR